MSFALPFVKTKIPPSSGNVPPVIPESQSQLERDDQDNSDQTEISSPPSRPSPQFTPTPQLFHIDPPTGNSSRAASQPPTQPPTLPPQTSNKMTKKLGPKRRLASSDLDRSFIEYLAAKKAKLSVPQEGDKKICAIKSFLDSLVPELEPMTEVQLGQFRRQVFVLIDSIYQSTPNYDYSSTSASSLSSPIPTPPPYTLLQMEPSPSHQYTEQVSAGTASIAQHYTEEVSIDGTTSIAQHYTDQGSTCATSFSQIVSEVVSGED